MRCSVPERHSTKQGGLGMSEIPRSESVKLEVTRSIEVLAPDFGVDPVREYLDVFRIRPSIDAVPKPSAVAASDVHGHVMVRKGPPGQVGHLRKEEKYGRADEFHGAECRNGSAETHLAPKADRLLRLGVPRYGVARRRRLLSERAPGQRRGARVQL